MISSEMPARNVVECGDMVLTWTREQDREILRACRTSRPRSKTFKALAKSFPHKSSLQVRAILVTLDYNLHFTPSDFCLVHGVLVS